MWSVAETLLGYALALTVLAAILDVRAREIPNALPLMVAGAFAAAWIVDLVTGGTGLVDLFGRAPLDHLWTGLGTLVVTFLLFIGRVLGGGDAKMIAALALWAGPLQLLPFLFWTSVCGACVALIVVLARHVPVPAGVSARHPWVVKLRDRKEIPYVAAVAPGALISLTGPLLA